jgi:hypothetical protein
VAHLGKARMRIEYLTSELKPRRANVFGSFFKKNKQNNETAIIQ